MTIEGGSRRHPVLPTPLGYDETAAAVKAAFMNWRTLDPVRAAALTAAVKLCCRDTDVSTLEVTQVAKEFEQYLTGEEAHDPNPPA